VVLQVQHLLVLCGERRQAYYRLHLLEAAHFPVSFARFKKRNLRYKRSKMKIFIVQKLTT